jgi:hypothetical protein
LGIISCSFCIEKSAGKLKVARNDFKGLKILAVLTVYFRANVRDTLINGKI